MVNRKKWAFLSAGVLALAAHGAATAQAVTAGRGNASSTTSPAAQADAATEIETVVVTAQRREEAAQDVPISISVLSASKLAATGVTSTADLASAVPALTFSSTSFTAQPFLRGVGTANVAAGDENSVAIYVDGVYHSAPVGSIFALNNVQRIEVDKGPQGTLFGRNAVGGVIQVITKDPKATPSFDLNLGYASYNTFTGGFYGTTGISDKLSADLALYASDQTQGWGKNLQSGKDAFLGQEYAARSKWRLDLGSTQFRLVADYDRSHGDFNTSLHAFPPARPLGTVAGTPAVFPGFYNIDSNLTPYYTVEGYGLSLTADHDLGWAHLTSISAYRQTNAHALLDQDMSPAQLSSVSAPYKDWTGSEELQLHSNDSSSLKWVGGLFYFHDNAHTGIQVSTATPIKATNGTQTLDSYAAFAQATQTFREKLDVTVGLRFTEDQRRLNELQIAPSTGAPLPFNPVSASMNFSKVTYRAAIDYHFTPNLMGYLEQSRGFKGGLFNMSAPLLIGTSTVDVVRPEVIDATEAGLKTSWFDHTLQVNASAFYYNFKDIQLIQFFVNGTTLLNAAQARIQGVDLDVEWLPVSQLDLTASMSFLDSTYTNFPNAPLFNNNPAGGVTETGGDASGTDTLQAPPFSANLSARYTIPLSTGSLSLDASYVYNGGFYWEFNDRLKNPPYNLVNASLMWKPQGAAWDVRLWGKNIFGERRYAFGASVAPLGNQASPAAPATVGVTFSLHH
jgi:iron complex outermembrane receptor protein